MQKIMIHGYSGKMGQMLEQVIKQNKGFEIVAGVGAKNEIEVSYDTYSDINMCEKIIDVIIDFSNAAAIDKLLDYANMRRIPLVLCTTGISDATIKKIKKYSKNIPILMSANMCLGVNVVNSMLKQISNILYNSNFDIELLERHHRDKVDAPSGTALLLADTIKSTLHHKMDYVYDRSDNKNEKRKKQEIGIYSVRGGTIAGEHSIIFAGEDEMIEIKHTAFSRKIFAEGAIKAARFIVEKENGVYSMDDVIAGAV